MICVSNACGQHSGRCPTPWTCGKYESEAKHIPVPFVVIEESDEPITTPEGFSRTFVWATWIGAGVMCLLLYLAIR